MQLPEGSQQDEILIIGIERVSVDLPARPERIADKAETIPLLLPFVFVRATIPASVIHASTPDGLPTPFDQYPTIPGANVTSADSSMKPPLPLPP